MEDRRIWEPARIWSYAVLLSGLYFLSLMLGFEEDVSILAGVNSGGYSSQYAGMIHLMLYVLFTCVVPVLGIAGAILWGAGRWVFPREALKEERG